MVTLGTAEWIQRRAGGRIVEVIPPRAARPRAATADGCDEAAHADGVRFCSAKCPGRKAKRKKRAAEERAA